jgi:hypothetical protein
MISLRGLNKAAVLVALYNNARTQGLGLLHYTPEQMTEEQAREILVNQHYFDYLKGRVMKVDLSGNNLDPRLYDRDNGAGSAQVAIDAIEGQSANCSLEE